MCGRIDDGQNRTGPYNPMCLVWRVIIYVHRYVRDWMLSERVVGDGVDGYEHGLQGLYRSAFR